MRNVQPTINNGTCILFPEYVLVERVCRRHLTERWRKNRAMHRAHTFFASWINFEYFWIACWTISSSAIFMSVRRTILGILAVASEDGLELVRRTKWFANMKNYTIALLSLLCSP